MDDLMLTYLEGFVSDRRKSIFNRVLTERTKHFTVVLENIFQSHNASAVVRSCDVFGVQDIYTIENNYINKYSRRIAKGSQKWIDIHRFKESQNNTEACFKELKAKGYQIVATSPHHSSSQLSDFDITKKSAFVFGVEKEGISEYAKANADAFLTIPMYGFTESLNISVAAAIILQDVTSRLKQSNVNWQLSDTEKNEIYSRWIEKSIKNIDKIKSYYLENLED